MSWDEYSQEELNEELRKRRMMQNKKRQRKKRAGKRKVITVVVAIILVAAIVIFSYTSCVSRSFDNMTAPLIENPETDKVTVIWHQVKNAEGYNVYKVEDNSQKTLVKTVQGEDTLSVEIKQEQATVAKYAVAPYKDNGEKEGKLSEPTVGYTLPVKQNALLVANKKLTATVSWQTNPNAAGYEIQIDKSAGFENPAERTVENKDNFYIDIENLIADQEYFARVRTFILVENEKKYGEWSDTTGGVTVIEKVLIDENKPMVALTFDDGPGNGDASDRIVSTFEKHGARATFFMVGRSAEQHPDNVRRKHKIRCEIGNHTYDHENYGEKVDPGNIRKCSDAIKDITGQRPTCFRSTGGVTTNVISAECEKEGLPLFYWTVDTQDWKVKNADTVYNHVMNNVSDGDIVLMHEIYPSTADAIERIVPELMAKGYQLVTVSELVRAKTGRPPVPGREYINGDKTSNVSYR